MPLALFALTIAAFAIGTTEFVLVGLIPTIASDLNITISSAGFLVSIYAIGVAIGAPVLTALTSKWDRKKLLISLIILFIIGNLFAWVSENYINLVFARFITGLAHGVFFSIGSTIATHLVPKEKEASAIAIMFSGLTIALVTGVPLGTYIGQLFGWRSTFLIILLLGFIALIGILFLIPSNLKSVKNISIKEQLKVITTPKLLLIYLITALGYGGNFIAFTYVSPILEEITGFSSGITAIILLIYGISVAFGNIWGGKIADKRGPVKALYRMFIGLALILVVFYFTASNQILAVITVLIWGAFAFGNVPPLQIYVVQLAEKLTPKGVDFASGLNIAAFNLGIALGAWGGGLVVSNLNLIDTTWIGAIIVLFGLILTYISDKINKKS